MQAFTIKDLIPVTIKNVKYSRKVTKWQGRTCISLIKIQDT